MVRISVESVPEYVLRMTEQDARYLTTALRARESKILTDHANAACDLIVRLMDEALPK